MAASTQKQLDQLQARFKPEEHKNRTQGGQQLTYVDISATLNRVNEVLGPNWSVVVPTKTTILPTKDGKFGALCELFIEAEIDGVKKTLYGVGAMTNTDPDMAAKTALAEAIKKAWHQAGVALYLWDAEARDQVNQAKAAAESPAARKKVLKSAAADKLGITNPTKDQVASAFDLEPADLDDDDVVSDTLRAIGLLT
jgi:hypothetical protein